VSIIVAIDGPAASGKSSTSAEVARQLGWAHLDSGALYRALTWVGLELGDPSGLDPSVILHEAERRGVALSLRGRQAVVLAGGEALDDRIRSPEVTAAVSHVAAQPAVRDWVTHRLRGLAATAGPVVVDGRDIGTAVFPDAVVKVFLVATPEVRAGRRLSQRGERLDPARLRLEAERIAARDRADATRRAAPMQPAPDALVLDTSALDFQAQVAVILDLIRKRGLPQVGPGA